MLTDIQSPDMSAMTKEILRKVQRMVPPMLDKFHKGWSNDDHCCDVNFFISPS